ncbi:hypothetical protein [Bremerella cremea]|uniref:hypothetical protein n=1 Tax=Bremerella cremea TaxID=1031537 RepID=UPI0031EDC250
MNNITAILVVSLLPLVCCVDTDLLLGDETRIPEGGIYPSNVTEFEKFPGDAFTLQQIKLGTHVRYSTPPTRSTNQLREPVDEDIERLSQVIHLESVYLYGGSISTKGIRHLDNCDSLRSYRHFGMKTSDTLVAVLCAIQPQLVRLELPDSDLTDHAADAISKLSTLEYLDLSGTNITSAFFIGHTFPKELSHLCLSGTQIDSKAIVHVPPSLTHLNLHGTNVGEESLPHLVKLKKLKALFLPSRNFSPAALDRLAEELPNARIGETSFSIYE